MLTPSPRFRLIARVVVTLGIALLPIVVTAQTITLEQPVTNVFQVIYGEGLPPNATFVLSLGGVGTNIGDTSATGRVPGEGFNVTNTPNTFPRSVELQFDAQTFIGIETATPYPRVVALSPFGTLILTQPITQAAAVITGSGFPPNCESSSLRAVFGGFLSHQVFLGGFNTPPDGSFIINFNFPTEAEAVTDYLWVGEGNCAGLVLRGANPGGPFPVTVSLVAFDLSSVPPSITIDPLEVLSQQLVSGSGLPPESGFALFRGGVRTSAADTDAEGRFEGGFGLRNVPEALPRSVALEFFEGPQDFTGLETDVPYPRTVALSPSGDVTFQAPETFSTAVISGAGFPPNCSSFLLTALAGETREDLGGGATDSLGTWAFNFSFPALAQNATDFLWEGLDSCADIVLHGSVPTGPYPRDIPMVRLPVRDVSIDVRPGSCPNPIAAPIHGAGVLPIAILGTADFDASQVIPTSVKLLGLFPRLGRKKLEPLGSALEDVATPFEGPIAEASDCTTAGADGFPDLVLKFDLGLVRDALGDPNGVRIVTLTGMLKDGSALIRGHDVVVKR